MTTCFGKPKKSLKKCADAGTLVEFIDLGKSGEALRGRVMNRRSVLL